MPIRTRALLPAETKDALQDTLVKTWSAESLHNFILTNIVDIPRDLAENYKEDADVFADIGSRDDLAGIVVDIIDKFVHPEVAEDLIELFQTYPMTSVAQTRYYKPPISDWSEETRTPRTPERPYAVEPGAPDIKMEKDRIQKAPNYMEPDLYNKVHSRDPAYFKEEPAYPAETINQLNSLDSEDQEATKNALLRSLKDSIGNNMPGPYWKAYLEQYGFYNDRDDLLKYIYRDGVTSWTRFGMHINKVLKTIRDYWPLEDVYKLWYQLMNTGEFPFVTDRFVKERFGHIEAGEESSPIYEGIQSTHQAFNEYYYAPKDTLDIYLSGDTLVPVPILVWPTREQKQEGVTPHWEYPAMYEQYLSETQWAAPDKPILPGMPEEVVPETQEDEKTQEDEIDLYRKSALHRLINARRVLNMMHG